MSVPGGEQINTDPGRGVAINTFHEPDPQAAAPIFGMDVNVAEPGEGGVICDYAGKANHPLAVQHGKHDGVFQ